MSTKLTTANGRVITLSNPMKLLDVIVIGGGLSGVLVSHGLQQQQLQTTQQSSPLDWKLLEARPVLGGRLANDAAGRQIDMGGAWIWPAHQPRVRKLVRQLDIPTFVQPDDPSSTRIEGGAVRLVEQLAQDLPSERMQLNTAVQSCTLLHRQDTNDRHDANDASPIVQVQTTANETFFARRVVWAVPPRLLHEHVKFDPPLSPLKRQALAEAHTWMAGVTKVALVYGSRFWSLRASNMGLPSHLGPAFQVYDSSNRDNTVSALTFFALAKDNVDDDAALAKQVADQMANVWNYLGEKEAALKAHSFTEHFVQRWPQQAYISEDPRPTHIHPHPAPEPALSTTEWGGLLHFAGSEMDSLSPGVMEGAIGAAQRVLQALKDTWTKEPAVQAAICGTDAAGE